MKIILGAIKEFNDDALIMARQLGAEGFHFNTPPIATNDENYWTERSLRWLKEYTEKFELKLEMIENVPIRFFDKILLGLPGRDEQIENYIKTLCFANSNKLIASPHSQNIFNVVILITINKALFNLPFR